MGLQETSPLLLIVLAALLRPGSCIHCYQCNSTDLDNPFQCQEWLTDDIDIEPTSCDEVYNAAYCIKHTGRFEGESITCYDCIGDYNVTVQSNCTDVFEASFCVKETCTQSGGVGTRRYCSSVDMGNYCNYIRQPGDTKEYRSCVFTCDSDGCNHASGLLPRSPLTAAALLLLLAAINRQYRDL